MALTANEQYLLELMNRARLDPAGEAARMGIGLNDGLAAGTISASAKQVLAPNALLKAAATKHSLWMLSADIFSHTGQGGTDPGDRITAQGYDWMSFGCAENIAYIGSTATVTIAGVIEQLNKALFLSAYHRLNLMWGAMSETGLGAELGQFRDGSTNYNAVLLTEDFGTQSTAHFLTGVAYEDADKNHFYGVGEGQGGITFLAQGKATWTASAGGYALGLTSGSAVAVTGSAGGTAFALTLDMSLGNVKLDLVSGKTFYTSGDIVLGTGVNNALLLGVDSLDATGNGARNVLTGNKGANLLEGKAGNDALHGAGGADLLNGGQGDDRLGGGTGADRFVFDDGTGSDRVRDFSLAQGDRLLLDDALWGGSVLSTRAIVSQFGAIVTGAAQLDFGGGDIVHLTGVTTLNGLSGAIDLI